MPDFGDGSAREDYGQVDGYAPSVANGQITPAQWAEYQAKRRKDALLGVLGVLGGSVALGGLGAALGGPAGGAASSATINGLPMAPYAGTAAMVPPAVGTGIGAATGIGTVGAGLGNEALDRATDSLAPKAGGLLGGLDGKDLMGLLAALTSTVGVLKSQPTNTAPTSATTDPQLQELITMMQGRLKKAEPLQDSVLAMANGLLPTQYQNGGRG